MEVIVDSNQTVEVLTVQERRPSRPQIPDVDGYLKKLKHKSSIFGSWTRRYFRVNPVLEQIEYFRNKDDVSNKPPSGSVSLPDITSIKLFDDCSFQIEAKPDVYLLRASSVAEQTCWIQSINKYIRERQEYERFMSVQ